MFYSSFHYVSGIFIKPIQHINEGNYRDIFVDNNNGEMLTISLFGNPEQLKVHSMTKDSLIEEFNLKQVRLLHEALSHLFIGNDDENVAEEIDDLLQVFVEAERLMEDAVLKGYSDAIQLKSGPQGE